MVMCAHVHFHGHLNTFIGQYAIPNELETKKTFGYLIFKSNILTNETTTAKLIKTNYCQT